MIPGCSPCGAPSCWPGPTSSSTTGCRWRRCSTWRRRAPSGSPSARRPGRPTEPRTRSTPCSSSGAGAGPARRAAQGRRPVRVRPRRRGGGRAAGRRRRLRGRARHHLGHRRARLRRHPRHAAALVDPLHRRHRPRGPGAGDGTRRLGGRRPPRRHDRRAHGRGPHRPRSPSGCIAGGLARRHAGGRGHVGHPARAAHGAGDARRPSPSQPVRAAGRLSSIGGSRPRSSSWFERPAAVRPARRRHPHPRRRRRQLSAALRELGRRAGRGARPSRIDDPADGGAALRRRRRPAGRRRLRLARAHVAQRRRARSSPRIPDAADGAGRGGRHRPGHGRGARRPPRRGRPRARALRRRGRCSTCSPTGPGPGAAGPGRGRPRRAARRPRGPRAGTSTSSRPTAPCRRRSTTTQLERRRRRRRHHVHVELAPSSASSTLAGAERRAAGRRLHRPGHRRHGPRRSASRVDVEADEHTIDGLVAALVAALAGGRRSDAARLRLRRPDPRHRVGAMFDVDGGRGRSTTTASTSTPSGGRRDRRHRRPPALDRDARRARSGRPLDDVDGAHGGAATSRYHEAARRSRRSRPGVVELLDDGVRRTACPCAVASSSPRDVGRGPPRAARASPTGSPSVAHAATTSSPAPKPAPDLYLAAVSTRLGGRARPGSVALEDVRPRRRRRPRPPAWSWWPSASPPRRARPQPPASTAPTSSSARRSADGRPLDGPCAALVEAVASSVRFPDAPACAASAAPRPCAASSPRPGCRVDDLVAPLFVREGIDRAPADRQPPRRRAAHPGVAAQGGRRARRPRRPRRDPLRRARPQGRRGLRRLGPRRHRAARPGRPARRGRRRRRASWPTSASTSTPTTATAACSTPTATSTTTPPSPSTPAPPWPRPTPAPTSSPRRGMMDGQVAAIRDALDGAGHTRRGDPRLRRQVRLGALRPVPRRRRRHHRRRRRPQGLPAGPGQRPRGARRGAPRPRRGRRHGDGEAGARLPRRARRGAGRRSTCRWRRTTCRASTRW